MGCCCAPNCSNRHENGVKMFHFPTNPERRNRWLINCRRDKWEPTRHSQLCEIHFDTDQFEPRIIDCKKLKPNAIPTIFNFEKQINNKCGHKQIKVVKKTDEKKEDDSSNARKRRKTSNKNEESANKNEESANKNEESANKNEESKNKNDKSVKNGKSVKKNEKSGKKKGKSSKKTEKSVKKDENSVSNLPNGTTMKDDLADENEPRKRKNIKLIKSPERFEKELNEAFNKIAEETSKVKQETTTPSHVLFESQSKTSAVDHSYIRRKQSEVLNSTETSLTSYDLQSYQSELQRLQKIKLMLERRLYEFEKIKRKYRHLRMNLSRFLCEDQIDSMCNFTGSVLRVSRWSNEALRKGLHVLNSVGRNGYDFLRKSGYPLPSERSLFRSINNKSLPSVSVLGEDILASVCETVSEPQEPANVVGENVINKTNSTSCENIVITDSLVLSDDDLCTLLQAKGTQDADHYVLLSQGMDSVTT